MPINICCMPSICGKPALLQVWKRWPDPFCIPSSPIHTSMWVRHLLAWYWDCMRICLSLCHGAADSWQLASLHHSYPQAALLHTYTPWAVKPSIVRLPCWGYDTNDIYADDKLSCQACSTIAAVLLGLAVNCGSNIMQAQTVYLSCVQTLLAQVRWEWTDRVALQVVET